ncbi:MAG: hypothetical protein C4324_02230 [Blastocatellia bacterium]
MKNRLSASPNPGKIIKFLIRYLFDKMRLLWCKASAEIQAIKRAEVFWHQTQKLNICEQTGVVE